MATQIEHIWYRRGLPLAIALLLGGCAASNAPFVTKKNAAMAPMWKPTIAVAVIQFVPF